MATPAESFWYAYGPQGVTRQLVNSTDSATVSTTNDPSTWTDTLTVAAPSASGSTPSCPAGTYYVTVQAAGGGYTDSVILAVTVTSPSVAVTSPANGSVYQVGASIPVSASADATDGSLSLSSVTISEGGTALGTVTYPLTSGEPTSFLWTVVSGANVFTATAVYGSGWGEVSVTSAAVTATGGSVAVTNGAWGPDPAAVGAVVSGPVTAKVGGGVDSDGSGATFVTYDWSSTGIWCSPDGVQAFSPYCGGSAVAIIDPGIKVLVGEADSAYFRAFADPGYFILGIECTATVHSSATGAQVGSPSGIDNVGASRAQPSVMAEAQANAGVLRPHQAPAPQVPTGGPASAVPVGQGWEVSFCHNDGTKISSNGLELESQSFVNGMSAMNYRNIPGMYHQYVEGGVGNSGPVWRRNIVAAFQMMVGHVTTTPWGASASDGNVMMFIGHGGSAYKGGPDGAVLCLRGPLPTLNDDDSVKTPAPDGKEWLLVDSASDEVAASKYYGAQTFINVADDLPNDLSNIDLVVLSGCGVGSDGAATPLAQAFLNKHVKSVVAVGNSLQPSTLVNTFLNGTTDKLGFMATLNTRGSNSTSVATKNGSDAANEASGTVEVGGLLASCYNNVTLPFTPYPP